MTLVAHVASQVSSAMSCVSSPAPPGSLAISYCSQLRSGMSPVGLQLYSMLSDCFLWLIADPVCS